MSKAAANADAPAGAAHSARVAVIGSGPLAAEVVRNLGLAGIPVAIHRPEDFWMTLRLAELQDCYSAVAAGVDPDARRQLNRLSQVAGVDFVNLSLDAAGITVESFPFGSDAGCACLECGPPMTGADTDGQASDPIAASVAGALGAAAALHCRGHGARRLHIQALDEPGTSAPLERRSDCAACEPAWRAPRVIRTRNRWSARESVMPDTAQLAAQTLRLSDALVTRCECAACGPVDGLADVIDRRATDIAAESPTCPACGSASLRIETRDEFTLKELMARFAGGPIPAKFALADIGGATVCFDLEAGLPRDAGNPPGLR
jgi:hypothetical protein